MKKFFYFSLSVALIVITSIVTLNFISKNDSKLANFSFVTKEFQNILDFNFLNFKTFLSSNGSIYWTNKERAKYGLTELIPSETLNQIAMIRLEDMEEKQYFDHFSPTGEGASDEANKIGFEFLTIGENIAVGNFKNDELLIDAWMNSPEHKENILSSKYTQIGIATKEVDFEGRRTWLAVQIFARPLTDCKVPSKSLKEQIDSRKRVIEIKANSAQTMYQEMLNDKNNGRISEYNAQVPIYNSLAEEINMESQNLKLSINEYNNEVNTFNYCLKN